MGEDHPDMWENGTFSSCQELAAEPDNATGNKVQAGQHKIRETITQAEIAVKTSVRDLTSIVLYLIRWKRKYATRRSVHQTAPGARRPAYSGQVADT